LGFCICESDAVLLCVLGVALFALLALFGVRIKFRSDQAVWQVGLSQVSRSVVIALCGPVYLVIANT
jgi:hypothetical protein